MGIYTHLDDAQRSLDALSREAREQQRLLHEVLTATVALHQRYRLEKNYAVSDALRSALNAAGVTIVQGTAQYGGYENIPEAMKGRPGDDTYILTKDKK